MARILVTGVKEPAGGVENIVMAYVRHFSPSAITADFAVFGEKLSFEDEITARGGKVYYLPDRKTAPAKYKAALNSIFSENRYDAVWCSFSGLTNIDFLKKAKQTGVGLRIAHAHTSGYFWGNKIMKYVVPVLHNINKVLLPLYANRLWTCSEKAAVFMFGKKHSGEAEIVKNAIDAPVFRKNDADRQSVREEFGIAPDALVVGHVGRMCTAKNQFFLLDTFKTILNEKPDAKLLFIGDGELHDRLIEYTHTCGLEKSVIYTGTRNDIPRLLQAFDVFALPSVSEGLPVVLIEAQAADIPCVTSTPAVTKEVDVTGTVDFVQLDKPAEFWAKEIIKAAGQKQTGGIEKLKNSGYDINTEAKKLEKIFLENAR